MSGAENTGGNRELDVFFKVEYSGFTPRQESWVKNSIRKIGLPTQNLRRVVYLGNDIDGREDWLGHWQRRNFDETHRGELALYKNLEDPNLPEIAHLETMVHELAHANSPLRPENSYNYGGEKNRQRFEHLSREVARQTKATKVFLNPYHAHLYQKLQSGEIDDDVFVEEIQAILVELRVTNPNHLRQVEAAQIRKMIMRGLGSSVSFFDGVSDALVNLYKHGGNPDIKGRVELEQHILKVRNGFGAIPASQREPSFLQVA
ncbi:hypothetical protein A2125_02675 [Candidatus Woesebacteria bacterium GWB1_43_5]|uniref:Uncharacterized protein n=1 Tax=Candidatus Woesebacteria bacterium GWB1_43_5 TaxID=1802474 RepID=A0A1F7WSE7_9BACT|nr:MAG: hypothetical protein A2125_02675 [Candidatus Woesebacteria bacterium GWB1_43_5]